MYLQRLLLCFGWNVGLEPTTALGDIPGTKGTLVSLWWLVFQFILSRYSFTRAALIGHCLQGKNKALSDCLLTTLPVKPAVC